MEVTVPQTMFDRFTDLERRLRVIERSPTLPILQHGWRASPATVVAVTSATFVTAWTLTIQGPSSSVVSVTVTTVQGAGTTGELRLTVSGGGSTTAKVLPAGVTTTTVFRWAHGALTGSGAAPITILLEARRTGGANNVDVQQPDALAESPLVTPAAGGVFS